jgi:hypothetical protein
MVFCLKSGERYFFGCENAARIRQNTGFGIRVPPF